MDLLQNPFYILNASPRDNRRRIVELADERSLLLDSSTCMDARSHLTNPRKRLSAEVAWVFGLTPKSISSMIVWLSRPIKCMPPSIEKAPPLVLTNVLAAGLSRLSNDCGTLVFSEWIIALSSSFEDIEVEKVCSFINIMRIESGFPEIKDISIVEDEIQNLRRYYRQVLKSALDKLPPKEIVKAVTAIVENVTKGGEEQGPILVADLVDLYEAEAQVFLDQEEVNIRSLVEKIRNSLELKQCPKCGHVQSKSDECEKCQIFFHNYIELKGGDTKVGDSVLAPSVNQLIQVLKNWDSVAQPIQVSAKSRGLNHDASHRVAYLIRDLAINMFNDHGNINFSQQLTKTLQEVFAEVGEVAERTAEDAATLEDIANQRARLMEDARKRAEEWRREITYEANVGAIFTDKLRISPEGIEWKGRRWELDSITRVRWGGTRHSVNGIPTGTTFTIVLGNDSNYTSIVLKNETTYSNFIERLWRAVGVRLLTEYLEGLRDGKKYRFSTAVMSDNGMELERKKLFGRNEKVFCRWVDLYFWNGAGTFCVEKIGDNKLNATFSYQDDDNIHVLEAAILLFRKRGGIRLSSLLRE